MAHDASDLAVDTCEPPPDMHSRRMYPHDCIQRT